MEWSGIFDSYQLLYAAFVVMSIISGVVVFIIVGKAQRDDIPVTQTFILIPLMFLVAGVANMFFMKSFADKEFISFIKDYDYEANSPSKTESVLDITSDKMIEITITTESGTKTYKAGKMHYAEGPDLEISYYDIVYSFPYFGFEVEKHDVIPVLYIDSKSYNAIQSGDYPAMVLPAQ